MVNVQTAIDFESIKARQRGAWSAGDYAVVGTTLQIVGERLCEAIDLRAGQRVLDVAAGNGNFSLAAARCGCDVVSTDYVPELLARGEQRARADGLNMQFREADAEFLPFGDGSFDVVGSTFGVMFTANHERAAQEMIRVCKHGGKIGLANWTPDSFIGELFKVIGRYVPPPTGARSPAQWGTRERMDELFQPHAASIITRKQMYDFRYRSADHWVDVFRRFYGPVLKAFAALPSAAQAQLEEEIRALIGRFNRSQDETVVVSSEYLEVVVVKW